VPPDTAVGRPGDGPALPAAYAVVVVAYARPDLVERVVASVRAQVVPPTVTVVVENPSSTSATAAVLGVDGVEALVLGANEGFAAAVNRGIDRVRDLLGPDALVAVLSHDTELPVAAMADLLPLAEALSGPFVVGSAVTDSGGRFGLLGLGGFVDRRTARIDFHPLDPAPLGGRSDGPAGLRDVDWVDGSFLLTSVRTWASVGGLHEAYFLYFEDVDFCTSVRRAGGRVLVADVVTHQEVAGPSPYSRGRSSTIYARRHGTAWFRVVSLLRNLAGAGKLVARRDAGGARQRLAGVRDGLRDVRRPELVAETARGRG
jgi:GT2 family glycosyltransferase